jgi:hypothetical protein
LIYLVALGKNLCISIAGEHHRHPVTTQNFVSLLLLKQVVKNGDKLKLLFFVHDCYYDIVIFAF